MSVPSRPDDLQDRLETGARLLGIDLSDEVSKRLLQFLTLLIKWNKAYNLTALQDPLKMVERHLLDSLSVLDHLRGEQILDMGTGAGLPGVPLALLRPHSHFVLLDGNNKKIRFVRQAVLELGIGNIQTVHARVEDYRPHRPFDTLISRAFTDLPKMVELTQGLWTQAGSLLAMKGALPEAELAQLPADLVVRVISLNLPFSHAERHLIEIRHRPQ